jgi:hypothetical protein
MGYCAHQVNSEFFIPINNFVKVVKAIHHLAKNGRRYSWVRDSYTESQDIKDIFCHWRWSVEFDDDGNICHIYFNGQKLGDDEVLFRAIAPYVKSDSFIEMRGEDNAMWRWHFSNGICKEQHPQITWG